MLIISSQKPTQSFLLANTYVLCLLLCRTVLLENDLTKDIGDLVKSIFVNELHLLLLLLAKLIIFLKLYFSFNKSILFFIENPLCSLKYSDFSSFLRNKYNLYLSIYPTNKSIQTLALALSISINSICKIT